MLLFCRYYQGKLVTLDVSVTVYLSWVLGFVGVLLLPYDLSVSLVLGVQSQSLVNVWKTIYWSTFILAWVVLPMQYTYHSSGHFTFKKKVCTSYYMLSLPVNTRSIRPALS